MLYRLALVSSLPELFIRIVCRGGYRLIETSHYPLMVALLVIPERLQTQLNSLGSQSPWEVWEMNVLRVIFIHNILKQIYMYN